MSNELRHEDDDFVASVRGLTPYVRDFIMHDWNWRPWRTEHPALALRGDGPRAQPPGYISDTTWTIGFEGAYPWAIDFTHSSNSEGAIKSYLDTHGLAVDCETGYAISVFRCD